MTATVNPNTQLSTKHANGQSPMIYQNIGQQIAAVEQIGKWYAMAGMASNPGEGAIMALACLYRGEDPITFKQEFMIVQGRPVRKYEMLLVDLENAGGSYEWIDDGEDGKKATIEIKWNGKTKRYTFTMEMAERAGLVKAGGGWKSWPGNMLRSKCVRQILQMHAPRIAAGYVTPEEATEMEPESPNQGPEFEKRRQEILDAAGQKPAKEQKTEPPKDDVRDAKFEKTEENPKKETEQKPKQSQPANGNGNGNGSDYLKTKLVEISQLANSVGVERESLGDYVRASFGEPTSLSESQCDELIAKFKGLAELFDKAGKLGVKKADVEKQICVKSDVEVFYQVESPKVAEMIAKVDAKAAELAAGN